MNTEKDRAKTKTFLKQKMVVRDISSQRELAPLIGLSSNSIRQTIWSNRWPIRCLSRLVKTLDTTKKELLANGFHFYEIMPRKKISIVGRNLDKSRHANIFPLFKAITQSGVKKCTVDELARLIEVQSLLSKPIDCQLVRRLIANIRNIRK